MADRQQRTRLRRSTEPRAYRTRHGPCQLIEGLPGSSPSHSNHKDPPGGSAGSALMLRHRRNPRRATKAATGFDRSPGIASNPRFRNWIRSSGTGSQTWWLATPHAPPPSPPPQWKRFSFLNRPTQLPPLRSAPQAILLLVLVLRRRPFFFLDEGAVGCCPRSRLACAWAHT
jgi:hypothetical protein